MVFNPLFSCFLKCFYSKSRNKLQWTALWWFDWWDELPAFVLASGWEMRLGNFSVGFLYSVCAKGQRSWWCDSTSEMMNQQGLIWSGWSVTTTWQFCDQILLLIYFFQNSDFFFSWILTYITPSHIQRSEQRCDRLASSWIIFSLRVWNYKLKSYVWSWSLSSSDKQTQLANSANTVHSTGVVVPQWLTLAVRQLTLMTLNLMII